jgi:hypothetical protein
MNRDKMSFMIPKDKLHQWLEKGVPAATYIVTATSANLGIMSILTGEWELVVTGILIFLAAIAAIFAYVTRRPRLAQRASMLSFLGWIYLCLYVVVSGTITALIAIAIPNVLLFAYYYLATMHERFWGKP